MDAMRWMLLAGLLCLGHDLPAEPIKRVSDFSLQDVRGKTRSVEEWKSSKVVVLIFLGLECPNANGYSPEFGRLHKEFAPQGVKFYGIHADPDVSAAAASKHAAEYKLPFDILLDPKHLVVQQVGATKMPESAVLTNIGELMYLGRIDDRFPALGKRRDAPTTHELADAIKAVLAGKTPAIQRTTAVGCPLPEPLKD